jgi:hypothetical protein
MRTVAALIAILPNMEVARANLGRVPELAVTAYIGRC